MTGPATARSTGTGSGANLRFYGSNAHHDVTWTAGDTGSVSNILRYDPWGTLTASSGSSLPDFRFPGNWHDSQTNLAWIVTRWYAPALARFISEDDFDSGYRHGTKIETTTYTFDYSPSEFAATSGSYALDPFCWSMVMLPGASVIRDPRSDSEDL